MPRRSERQQLLLDVDGIIQQIAINTDASLRLRNPKRYESNMKKIRSLMHIFALISQSRCINERRHLTRNTAALSILPTLQPD